MAKAKEPTVQEQQQLATTTIQTPAIGRIVHFRLATGDSRPAIIVDVHNQTAVDLQIFTNGEADRRGISERIVMINSNNGVEHHAVPSMVYRANVTEGNQPGQWSWPVTK